MKNRNELVKRIIFWLFAIVLSTQLRAFGSTPPSGVPQFIVVSDAEDTEYNGTYEYTEIGYYVGYVWVKGSVRIRNIGWAWAVEGSTNSYHNTSGKDEVLPPKDGYQWWKPSAWAYFSTSIKLSYEVSAALKILAA